jgi:hypothetical protein
MEWSVYHLRGYTRHDERKDTIEQRMATEVNETKLTFFWNAVFSLFLEF